MNTKRHMGIKSAYGQLILLVFLPITVLASVGAVLVFFETQRAIKNEQDVLAQAALIRHAPVVQSLLIKLDAQKSGNAQTPTETADTASAQAQSEMAAAKATAETALVEALNELNQLDDGTTSASILPRNLVSRQHNTRSEQNVQRLAVLDGKGAVLANVGMAGNEQWAIDPASTSVWRKPSRDTQGMLYGVKLIVNEHPYWLMVDMDNEPLVIASYRVLLALAITGLVTILLLLLSLNIYAKRWIAPIYEMRLYLQGLSAQKLDKATGFRGDGEFKLLQQDLTRAMRRLKLSFDELKKHSDETEADLQQAFDEMEMQNILIRKAHDLAVSTSLTKSTFLTNISHELRTPLNSIDGFINLLARGGNLDNKQSIYVETIKKSSAHLLALVNDVLDFSKIEAGKLSLERHSLNLYDTVYEVADMLSPSAWEKNLRLAVLMYNDVPTHITGDSLRLRQILTNLIGNAIKFTDSGHVTVTVALAEQARVYDTDEQMSAGIDMGKHPNPSAHLDKTLSAGLTDAFDPPNDSNNLNNSNKCNTPNHDPQGKSPTDKPAQWAPEADTQARPAPNACIRISIQDTGKGVDSANQDKLFESFNQGDLSITRRYGGTGLGLVICKELVHLMGGEIGFLDNQTQGIGAQGATFWFSLPVDDSALDHDEIDMSFAPPSLPARRLLVWLKDSATLQALHASLVGTGVEVMPATSFAHLLGQLGEHSDGATWDWVIADGFGEQEDILALIEQIRLQYQGKLAIFGYGASLDKAVLDKHHAHALSEPLDRRALYAMLGQERPMISSGPQAWSDKTVLIVDDHEPNLLVLEALLQEQGVQVIKAASGFDAIDIISEQLGDDGDEVIDLIFMDIRMPRMSGTQTTLEIRKLEKINRKAPIPIIALTAHAMHDEQVRLTQSGLDDYATKPMNQMTLTALLQKWLGNAPTLSLQGAEAIAPPPPPSQVTQATSDDLTDQPIDQSATGEPQLLDWQDGLTRAGGKAELAKKLLTILIADIENQRQALETAWAYRNRSELASITHRIVGGARYTGVPRLRVIAEDFEYKCRADIQEVSPMHFIAMRPSYRKLIDVLDDLQAVDLEAYLAATKTLDPNPKKTRRIHG